MHPGGVHVRLRQHLLRGGGGRRIRAVRGPKTGQIFYEAGFANFHLHPPTEVHFKNGERALLLIVGADADHTVPTSLSKAQYRRYERSPARTDYLEFAGRPHLHMAAPDWQEVAAAVDSLARRHPRRSRSTVGYHGLAEAISRSLTPQVLWEGLT